MDRPLRLLIALAAATAATAQDDFPVVPGDIEVALFASEPLVRNPCAITFDAGGRLCVGMGPQYRNPEPDTPGDAVWILTDTDNDGTADSRHRFATGFNAIQGLAWRGSELFVANAPDLTVVSDTDNDGTADRYVRLYTDLGNLEHALHGLNFGPDGKLYMSKGNSKGLTQFPDRLAPAPFRELWGVGTPPGTPVFPAPVTSTAATYQRNYHDPADDWGITGGVLRCNPDGTALEIVSRGFRNPWDIAFDHTFDWLGTDNDQTMGDKIFTPFFGAHFGWGHPWSYDWSGEHHLPTAPASGPLFEGSGTGVVFCGLPAYPAHYRDVFLINDWLRREVYIYRPAWDGAHRVPASEKLELLAHAGGGRSMPKSDGRSFDPVDIELGPDGAIWISSWGRQYGAHYENGQLANTGRIYRLWPKAAPPTRTERPDPLDALASHLPVWRTDAQDELVRRGPAAISPLTELLDNPNTPPNLETWAIWTLGRISPEKTWRTTTQNQHLQSIRIQALTESPNPNVRTALTNPDPRIRLEAILSTRQTSQTAWLPDLLDLLATEQDRIVYYAAWGALTDLLPVRELKSLLADQRPPIRRAAFLALLEQDALTDQEIAPLTSDPDPQTAALATRRLGGKAEFESRGRPLAATISTAASSSPPPAVNPFLNITASSGRAYRTATLAPGTPVYTDRPYKIRAVPAELTGTPFLQTANNDADAASGITVTLDLKYPSTLYLADDARAGTLPAWAREGWQPTGLTIETDDPETMRLYRREAPAGRVTLGTNRDGVRARKGNYLLVAVPKLLLPTDRAATLESTLAALPAADPSRGRDLFLSPRGANCAACHQLAGVGNNHAPDLSDIGSRSDAEFIITSIINPSAAITEGFAAQTVTTRSGAAYTGILLEETGRHLTIAMTGGAKTTIPRADITAQDTLPISAMPPGFDVMLSAQQVAEITAYLLTLKGQPDAQFGFHPSGGALHIDLGDTRIATYLTDHPTLTRRALVNLHTPSGTPVTRPFPAPGTEDHAMMHPGLWIAFGWIDGNDYWRFGSKVQFDRYLSLPTADATSASFATRNHYLDQTGTSTVCTEDTHYQFQRTDQGIAIHIDASFYNDTRDFAFGDQEESGLALRMAKPLTVQHGNGRILNDTGHRDGAGTWGKPFRWIDYSGTVGGNRVGLLVVPHPDNPRPSWSHSRDYGALVANPFPKQPRERREPYVTTTVKKGERFRLRYTVHLHDSPAATFTPESLLK